MKKENIELIIDGHRTLKKGAEAIAQRQQARFEEMVRFARSASPYYRDLYRKLPDDIHEPGLLPVTGKSGLMARFNDWVTEPGITVDMVRKFVGNPNLIGGKLLGRFTPVTTSGTTGTPGLFLFDDQTMAVGSAMAARMLGEWLRIPDVMRIVMRNRRMTMVNATGGHFAPAVTSARLQKSRGVDRLQVLSAGMPLPEMVARLDRFRPAILASYATTAALLAAEQEAGRLHINPSLVVLSAEGLPPGEYRRIAEAFGAKVHGTYAAAECPFLGHTCAQGWLHVNSDWAILEPVDADYRPVEPGCLSHTVLLTNLANRVLPVLRYDLGDRVLMRPDPCPCGNPLPAIQVGGRVADTLHFKSKRGSSVSITAPVFATVIDPIHGVELYQVAQVSPTALNLRLRTVAGTDAAIVRNSVEQAIRQLLDERGLGHISIVAGYTPLVQTDGGKYRRVVPLPSRSSAKR